MADASVVFDAGVLAVPPLDGNADDAHRYVESLLDWAKLLDEPWIAICMTEGASAALFADELYPLRDQLRKLFSRHGIVEYDVNTVAIVIDRLLTNTPSFETYFRVRDILPENITTKPDVLQLCAGSGLQSELARCIVLLAVLRRHCGEDILQNALIVRRAPGQSIVVRALVHDFDHFLEGFDVVLPKPPEYFEGEVLVCDCFRSLLNCIDESKVLRNATDDAGVEIAIRIGLYKSRLARHVEPDWDDVGGMRLGGAFARQYVGALKTRGCPSRPAPFARPVMRSTGRTCGMFTPFGQGVGETIPSAAGRATMLRHGAAT